RRRQDPAEGHVSARGCEARRERGLEHLARLARVADHERPRRLEPAVQDGGTPERERELRRDLDARDAADAVGAKEPSTHHASTGGGVTTAWRTADACAP